LSVKHTVIPVRLLLTGSQAIRFKHDHSHVVRLAVQNCHIDGNAALYHFSGHPSTKLKSTGKAVSNDVGRMDCDECQIESAAKRLRSWLQHVPV